MLKLAEDERSSRERVAAAVVQQRQGELEEARQSAAEAVALDFPNPESRWMLGAILEQAGHRVAAHTEYGLALHLGREGEETEAAVARTAGETH